MTLTLTLPKGTEPPEAVSAGARGLLQRSYRVLRAVAEADPEEPVAPLQRGVVERLLADLKKELE